MTDNLAAGFPDRQYIAQRIAANLRSVGVPEKLSEQTADILSRQDANELPYPLPEKEQRIVSSAWQIKQAIQRRIECNHINGVQFMEGQMLPHGISLEVACELAEYWTRGMNQEAIALIQTLPQREIIERIYRAIADMDWEKAFDDCDDGGDVDFSDLFEVVPQVEHHVSALIEDRAWYEDFLAEAQKMNEEKEA
jgi:hypothetical protein